LKHPLLIVVGHGLQLPWQGWKAFHWFYDCPDLDIISII